MKEREQKNRQAHKKSDEAQKQHAPSRHGHDEVPGQHRGAHHGSPRGTESPASETDYPPPGRSPSEELSPGGAEEEEGS